MKWERLMEFLQRLQDAEMAYELKHSRDDAVSVWVDAVTEKWEVDFVTDGSIDVEVFASDGSVHDEDALDELFERALEEEEETEAELAE